MTIDRLLLILVPAFNEGAAVGNVIESVRATMHGVPILVVDDCSLDDTVSVAKSAVFRSIPTLAHPSFPGKA